MTEEEREETEQEYQRWWDEDQELVNDPVYKLFEMVSFQSRTKRKNHRRPFPITITLYRYRLDPLKRWRTIERMALDCLASEVYGHSECHDEREASLTDRLRAELPQRAKFKK